MKAPEKIYTDNRGVYAELPIFSQADANVEYIHKDALIEWVNRRLEEFRHIAEISNDVAADGEVNAFEELIDKLNSM